MRGRATPAECGETAGTHQLCKERIGSALKFHSEALASSTMFDEALESDNSIHDPTMPSGVHGLRTCV